MRPTPLSTVLFVSLFVWIWARWAPPARGAATTPSDPVAGKSHWAFQPLNRPRPQSAARSDWPRQPLDTFILDRLRSAGLEPGPDASPRATLRRVYLQLTGLPPSPEETAAFLENSDPDALARVVDRLLSSRHFGERWGRHWLDLARYADSNGLDENFLFREAWRYRNWVIDAINRDLPFDRFTLEQIAGDTLPFHSIEQRDAQRMAAGFLVIGPKVLLGNDPMRQRMEIADEQIDTVGRTFLGLTLGCARCHDHKFEPVPRADYYALAGIFTSTQVMEQRYMLGEQRVMERLVGLGATGDLQDAAYEKFWREHPKLKERTTQAKAAAAFLEKDDVAGLDGHAEKHPDAVADRARGEVFPLDKRLEAQRHLVATLEAQLSHPPKIPPRAMIPADTEAPADEAVRLAGQFDRLGERVPRGFLQVLHRTAPPSIPTGSSGRLQLGRWLTDVGEGAGALTARVVVNRLWHHLIGRGIVPTVDNFGRTGEAPSHPELLDYLAAELIDSGWSVKTLVRQIVLSRTFALSSAPHAAASAVDPDNRLLARAHRRRLDPEALRDAMLAAAGLLNPSQMDSSVWYLGDQATAVGKNEVRRRTDFVHRSVYLPVIRNDLPELYQAFDFADPHATTGARPQTLSAAQALYLLNDRAVMDAADALARRLLQEEPSTRGRIDRLFALALNSPPEEEERQALERALVDFAASPPREAGVDPKQPAWSLVCHAVLSLSRFQFQE